MNGFDHLPLSPALLEAVSRIGHERMTPVQAAGLPPAIAGRDLLAQAPTGSGKTLAFGLGLLSRIDNVPGTQALVLCPTRELAQQVAGEIRRLAQCLPNMRVLVVHGGVPTGPQAAALGHGPQVVVGTPGRVLDLLKRGKFDLSALRVAVLDEGDRMLDMGFAAALDAILAHAPKQRQTLLFSATWPEDLVKIARTQLRDPVELSVAAEAGIPESPPEIEHRLYSLGELDREVAVERLLAEHRPTAALVFCNTRAACATLTDSLRGEGFSALALHGDLDQRTRDEVLLRFANGSCTVLVATDVAARGLDIAGLPLVISHRLSQDADAQVHRSGRTGRAGQSGLALHLVGDGDASALAGLRARLSTLPEPLPLPPEVRRKPPEPAMATLRIDGGRRDRLRRGDILGALTGDAGLPGDAVGRIDIHEQRSYVAVERSRASIAKRRLDAGRIKNRRFRVSWLD